MFHSGNRGHKFSDILRKHARGGPREAEPSHSGTRNVGEHPKGAPRAEPGTNPGGVSGPAVPGARSIPSASRFMDGKENPVGRGTGQRVGSQNRGPGRIGESTRLGNFGQPPGHSTMGYDGPDAIEGAAEVPAPSKHMDGKSHPVHRRGKASRPRMNIGDGGGIAES